MKMRIPRERSWVIGGWESWKFHLKLLCTCALFLMVDLRPFVVLRARIDHEFHESTRDARADPKLKPRVESAHVPLQCPLAQHSPSILQQRPVGNEMSENVVSWHVLQILLHFYEPTGKQTNMPRMWKLPWRRDVSVMQTICSVDKGTNVSRAGNRRIRINSDFLFRSAFLIF